MELDVQEDGLGYDGHYCDAELTRYGADVVTYRVPLAAIRGWQCVQRLSYEQVERICDDVLTLPPSGNLLIERPNEPQLGEARP